MASLTVIPRPGKIEPEGLESIVMDVVSSESHDLSNTITDHPVEKGLDITDHVRPDPDTITLVCLISNTPLSTSQQSRAIRRGETTITTAAVERGEVGDLEGLALQAWKKLKKLRTDGTLVTVATTLEDYKSMVIKNLTAPRNAKNYDGLEFTITFRKIVIVENTSTRSTTTRSGSSQKKVKTGAQTTKSADSRPGSALFNTTDTLNEYFNGSENSKVNGTGSFLHN